MKENINHTFAICAYKESKYLEECINSLLGQTVKSNIIIATSTPNDYVKGLANKYNIKLYINKGKKGIGEDWNFAVSCTTTDYVTVAHQDDIYDKFYLEKIFNRIKKSKNPIIIFSKYKEIKNGRILLLNKNLKIKEIMLFPLKFFKKSRFIKKLVISLGNSICCPSVTLNTKIVSKKPYETGMKSNIDWDTWLKFSKIKGSFEYISEYLMFHRIHEESETSKTIESNKRIEEDFEMLKKFWPNSIAKILMKFYSKAVDSNS